MNLCILRFLSAVTVASLVAFDIAVVDAHGYAAASRNVKCVDGRNFDCGDITYEPQSLEAPKGFPNAGPADGQLASVGIGRFSELDEQSSDRWLKTNVQAGASWDVTWKFTANHLTTGFEYFMTKDAWNPDQPLSRTQFDLVPFCSVPFGGAKPRKDGETHTCTLPATKNGYHVILAVWIIDDTAAAFYNMIDVAFDGGTNPAPVASSSPVQTPTASPTIKASPPPTIVDESGMLCSSGLPLEAIDSCRGFVHCADGDLVPGSEKRCADGLLFDRIGQICDWDFNVQCASATAMASPTTAPTSTSSTEPPMAVTSAPVTVTTAPSVVAPVPSPPGGLCSSGQPLEPVEECTGFVYCVGGAPRPDSQVNCPPGLLFNSTLLVCDWANNVDCNL